jgi:two-component system, NtrC family, response regulator
VAKILIIDDNQMLCRMLQMKVEHMGHGVCCAHTLSDGIELAADNYFDVIFLDVRLPDGNGLKALPTLKSSPCNPEIIIITGDGDPDGAEVAVKNGAWDYIEKSVSTKEITLQLTQALKYREEKLSQKPAILIRHDELVGNAPNFTACLERVAHAATSDANVLITGETGTGKELFARAIHNNSARAKGNFVVVDCAALPETLVESVLFGHTKGAFTGASEATSGLVKDADGGTLFLDEVGELSAGIQKTFLRVLQEHRFRPLGGKEELSSNFRLIAATHRDLDQMCHDSRFRTDLLFRLRTIEISLPPLKERAEDIEALVLHFVYRMCKRYGIGIKAFSPEFLEALQRYGWPGNVRELSNAIDGAICHAQHQTVLYPTHLPTHVRVDLARTSVRGQACLDVISEDFSHKGAASFPSLKTLLEETEKTYLRNLLSATGGDIQKLSDISGVSRTRLYVRLKHHRLSRFT